ncbi:hypothetical protein CF641_38185, partial [Burkholderia pseudomallei]|uniref:hypothetical protein n=1 Tax=Burkholderia pseudomallei TaxID=28450 RepID=UPI000CCEE85F
MSGVIKVLLQMANGRLATSLHCDELNPYITPDGGPFRGVGATGAWPLPVHRAGRQPAVRQGARALGIGTLTATGLTATL